MAVAVGMGTLEACAPRLRWLFLFTLSLATRAKAAALPPHSKSLQRLANLYLHRWKPAPVLLCRGSAAASACAILSRARRRWLAPAPSLLKIWDRRSSTPQEDRRR